MAELRDMEHQLWDLFRETGEPMGYLLYCEGLRGKPEQTERTSGMDRKDGTAPSF